MKNQERHETSPARRFEPLERIAARWSCHRTTVRRRLEAAGVSHFRLGDDRRGVLRYDADEVAAYERACRSCGGAERSRGATP